MFLFVVVNVSEAGEGELDVMIKDSKGTVESALEHGKDEKLWVSFETNNYDLYDVYMTFNGEPIPGKNNTHFIACSSVIDIVGDIFYTKCFLY